MAQTAEKYAKIIKQKAEKFGFQGCGISKAGFLEEDATALEKWLKAGYNGEMAYMENYFDNFKNMRAIHLGWSWIRKVSLCTTVNTPNTLWWECWDLRHLKDKCPQVSDLRDYTSDDTIMDNHAV